MTTPCLLALNGGSSSIRFALYEVGASLRRVLDGKVERIGMAGTTLAFEDKAGAHHGSVAVPATDFDGAVDFLLDWLEARRVFATLAGVGHRVVHGMAHSEPALVDAALLDELKRITPYDPDHLPGERALMQAILVRHPQLPQVACFDTAFHRSMPAVARMLPIPRRYAAQGVERYGFHGLSYAYLMEELARLGDPAAARGRVILAHLGNGASLAAVRDGASIDTSMGFTPAAGLVMSTRSGDIDPGLVLYLARTGKMSAQQFQHMANHESGLLGVSETSSDLRDLLAHEGDDPRAAQAVELFCYQARKWIGAYAAALGGLDTLVFAGGIGENAAVVRERICAELGFLGIVLDPARNARHAELISADGGPVRVRVIRTDEEQMVARGVARLLGLAGPGPA